MPGNVVFSLREKINLSLQREAYNEAAEDKLGLLPT